MAGSRPEKYGPGAGTVAPTPATAPANTVGKPDIGKANFVDGGTVVKFTAPDPAPTRPATGGVSGKANPGVNTYFGGPPRGTMDHDTIQENIETASNAEEQA